MLQTEQADSASEDLKLMTGGMTADPPLNVWANEKTWELLFAIKKNNEAGRKRGKVNGMIPASQLTE